MWYRVVAFSRYGKKVSDEIVRADSEDEAIREAKLAMVIEGVDQVRAWEASQGEIIGGLC